MINSSHSRARNSQVGEKPKALTALAAALLTAIALAASNAVMGPAARAVPLGAAFFQGATCILLKEREGVSPQAVIACFDSEGQLMWSRQTSVGRGLVPTSLSLGADGVFIVGNAYETYQSVVIHLGWDGSLKWAEALSEANLRSSTLEDGILIVSGSCGYGVNESALVLLIDADGKVLGAWAFDTPARDVATSVYSAQGRIYVSGTSEWSGDLVSSFVLSFDPSTAEWPASLPEYHVTCFAMPVLCSTDGGDFEIVALEGVFRGGSVNLSAISAEGSIILSAGSAWLPGGDSRSVILALDGTGKPLWAQVGPPGSLVDVSLHRERATLVHISSAGAAEARLLTTLLTSGKGFTSFLLKDAVVLGASVDEGRVRAVAFAKPGVRPQIVSEGVTSWDSVAIEAVLGCDAALCTGGLHSVSLNVSPVKPDLRTSLPGLDIYYIRASENLSEVEIRPLWRAESGIMLGRPTRLAVLLAAILAVVIVLLVWGMQSARRGGWGS